MDLEALIPTLEVVIEEYFLKRNEEEESVEGELEALVAVSLDDDEATIEHLMVVEPKSEYQVNAFGVSEEHTDRYEPFHEVNVYDIYREDAELSYDESNLSEEEVREVTMRDKVNSQMSGSIKQENHEQTRKLENYKLLFENRVWLRVLYDLTLAT